MEENNSTQSSKNKYTENIKVIIATKLESNNLRAKFGISPILIN
jgi:hypothetical protein